MKSIRILAAAACHLFLPSRGPFPYLKTRRNRTVDPCSGLAGGC